MQPEKKPSNYPPTPDTHIYTGPHACAHLVGLTMRSASCGARGGHRSGTECTDNVTHTCVRVCPLQTSARVSWWSRESSTSSFGHRSLTPDRTPTARSVINRISFGVSLYVLLQNPESLTNRRPFCCAGHCRPIGMTSYAGTAGRQSSASAIDPFRIPACATTRKYKETLTRACVSGRTKEAGPRQCHLREIAFLHRSGRRHKHTHTVISHRTFLLLFRSERKHASCVCERFVSCAKPSVNHRTETGGGRSATTGLHAWK